MKKVRVLKEMPFAKVGEEFETRGCPEDQKDGLYLPGWSFHPSAVESMIRTSWLEWVEEEKSLEEKFKGLWLSKTNQAYTKYSHTAKDHFLEVFDKAHIKYWGDPTVLNIYAQHIRKALEEA